MSKKRCADNYITDQNWDRENEDDEKEAAPEPFKPASEDVLAKRSFKKAARRVKTIDNKEKANPFAAFSGFGSGFGAKAPSIPSKPITFDGKASDTTEVTGFNLGGCIPTFKIPESSTTIKTPVKPAYTFSFAPKPTPEAEGKAVSNKPVDKVETNITRMETIEENDINDIKDNGNIMPIDNKAKDDDTPEETEDTYLIKLASLNKCLLKWIEKHMEDNNCIDLSPVFGDYEKHLKKINT